ncbi:MAG: hypothetical protein C0597_12890 [Marinilabiliales bacterium]|nr:MAG: hypothetical protein C0597_12890 [Marinilabiliales bacterium]
MFRNYYHYFIAGLPDIFLDDTEVQFHLLDFKHELEEHLRPEDYKLVELLFLPYDNQNLLQFLDEDFDQFNKLGKYTFQDFEVEFSDEREGMLPSYMYDFVEIFKDEELSKNVYKSWENLLTEMYYKYVLKTKNKFLKQWFEFNLNLNNILIGLNCRQYDLDAEKNLISDNEITRSIIKSNAKDFGLSVDLPYVSDIIVQAEKENLMAREKGLDQIKWEKVEEITLFDYFTIEVVLAYTIKLDLAYRWLELDEEKGREMFGKIINYLKSSFEFPKEFAINGKNK